MSGIEVVLIVGAGILITKKVKQHRREKKQKELADAGLLPEQHAPAQVVRQQRNSAEDEALPLYSPPTKEYTSGHLPSYDDIRKENPESLNSPQSASRFQTPVQSQSQPSMPNTTAADKKTSRKWKLWDRSRNADGTLPEGTDSSRLAQ